jgi:hypothetical protein
MLVVVQKKRTKRELGDDERYRPARLVENRGVKVHSADARGFASTSAPPGVQDGVELADT